VGGKGGGWGQGGEMNQALYAHMKNKRKMKEKKNKVSYRYSDFANSPNNIFFKKIILQCK
jgi:hypothetical protein